MTERRLGTEMDRWLPLSTSDQQIRLLEVASREYDPDHINCQLKIVSLQSDPVYEALSYVWGGWDNAQEIMLNGSKHTVTKNLYDALRIMQRADCPRTLWVRLTWIRVVASRACSAD